MSHTPGPWYVGTRSAFTQEIEILAGPLRAVGSAYTEDDARVMAAAPKLLEALKQLLPEMRGLAIVSPLMQRYVDICESAIKEATGGAV